MSNTSQPQKKPDGTRGVEKLAERMSQGGMSSEKAHREAAKIARDTDARNKGGK